MYKCIAGFLHQPKITWVVLSDIDKQPFLLFGLDIMLHDLYRKWAVEDVKPLLK